MRPSQDCDSIETFEIVYWAYRVVVQHTPLKCTPECTKGFLRCRQFIQSVYLPRTPKEARKTQWKGKGPRTDAEPQLALRVFGVGLRRHGLGQRQVHAQRQRRGRRPQPQQRRQVHARLRQLLLAAQPATNGRPAPAAIPRTPRMLTAGRSARRSSPPRRPGPAATGTASAPSGRAPRTASAGSCGWPGLAR